MIVLKVLVVIRVIEAVAIMALGTVRALRDLRREFYNERYVLVKGRRFELTSYPTNWCFGLNVYVGDSIVGISFLCFILVYHKRRK